MSRRASRGGRWTMRLLFVLAVETPRTPPTPVDAAAPDAGPRPPRVTGVECAPAGACRLPDDQGCPAGQLCELDSRGEPTCNTRTPGAGAEGDPCETANDCGSGVNCNALVGRCVRYCCADEDCGEGFGCFTLFEGGMGICSPDDDCDPVDGSGCEDGNTCYQCWLTAPAACVRMVGELPGRHRLRADGRLRARRDVPDRRPWRTRLRTPRSPGRPCPQSSQRCLQISLDSPTSLCVE